MEGGEYIEIAGGSITEIVEEDYNIYAGGHIINTASKCIFETGENKDVKIKGNLKESTASTVHKALNGDILIQGAGVTTILGQIDAKINKG